MKVIIDFKIESESKGTCMKNEMRSEITDLFWLSRYVAFLSSAWKNPRTLVVILFSDFCCLLGQITKKRIFGGNPLYQNTSKMLPFFQALDKTKTDEWFSSPSNFSPFNCCLSVVL